MSFLPTLLEMNGPSAQKPRGDAVRQVGPLTLQKGGPLDTSASWIDERQHRTRPVGAAGRGWRVPCAVGCVSLCVAPFATGASARVLGCRRPGRWWPIWGSLEGSWSTPTRNWLPKASCPAGPGQAPSWQMPGRSTGSRCEVSDRSSRGGVYSSRGRPATRTARPLHVPQSGPGEGRPRRPAHARRC